MSLTDIRPLKKELRDKYRRLRQEMSPEIKNKKDEAIARQVRRLWQYKKHNTLLLYVSTPIEVDTRRLIEQALKDGKKVAVPRCVPGTREMEFYRISSLDQLQVGSFGVLEPCPDGQQPIGRVPRALCVVPAFCYDKFGFRLGYGKGYYDRFLSGYEGRLIGICYQDCITGRLPHGRYDRAVELVVTEQRLYKIEPRGGKGFERKQSES